MSPADESTGLAWRPYPNLRELSFEMMGEGNLGGLRVKGG